MSLLFLSINMKFFMNDIIHESLILRDGYQKSQMLLWIMVINIHIVGKSFYLTSVLLIISWYSYNDDLNFIKNITFVLYVFYSIFGLKFKPMKSEVLYVEMDNSTTLWIQIIFGFRLGHFPMVLRASFNIKQTKFIYLFIIVGLLLGRFLLGCKINLLSFFHLLVYCSSFPLRFLVSKIIDASYLSFWCRL
jgi:hypothetical protein